MTTRERLRRYAGYALRPVAVVRSVRRRDLRPDLVAGLTVAVVAVPQCIAYASIAGLPPAFGLYSACVASIFGSLWGSSRFLSTGPTNAISVLALSVLAPLAAVGSGQYLLAAGAMAVMVGLFCVVFGLLGFGMLVNFASRAVLLGFTAGAGVLIAVGQMKSLLRLDIERSPHMHRTLAAVVEKLSDAHWISLALGVATVALTLIINRFSKKLPGSLLALVATGLVVAVVGIERLGVQVVGEVARAAPQLSLAAVGWLLDSDLVGAIILGSLAVASLGVVEAVSIAREIARQSGERLDVNQELVGQGVANAAAGLLGGYASSGSFTRSAINFQAGARTQMAGVFCGLFVLFGTLAFGPWAAFLPRPALAGLIMLIAYKMVDWGGVRRVLRTSPSESAIMASTFVATLVFPLEFAVLAGIILSLGIYIYQSSMPVVQAVVPDPTYRHFVERAGAPPCPQLAVMNIRGDLFFGAASHVEDALLANYQDHPGQRLLLLRMHGVNRCDLSGIDVLEGMVRLYRDSGGDVYLVQVRPQVREIMGQSGFEELLGSDHILAQEAAVEWLFENVIDPAVCVYECEHRVFAECQPLEKHPYDVRLPAHPGRIVHPDRQLPVREFEDALRKAGPEAVLLDVREPEEFRMGHLAGSRLLPLRSIIDEAGSLDQARPTFLICRSGRRSTRALHWLLQMGFESVCNLKGGILSWKSLGRPVEVD